MRSVLAEIERLPDVELFGRVTGIQGLLVEIAGVQRHLSIGSCVRMLARGGRQVEAEVVGFRQGRALAMPFGSLEGVGMGCKALQIGRASCRERV